MDDSAAGSIVGEGVVEVAEVEDVEVAGAEVEVADAEVAVGVGVADVGAEVEVVVEVAEEDEPLDHPLAPSLPCPPLLLHLCWSRRQVV